MPQRILVVDDESDIRELLRVNLVQAGFEVEAAETGEEALEAIRRDPPDLVILDLMLPDRSGTDVCRQIRADPAVAHVPIVMLTARGEEVDRVVGLELGADDYVVKPFSPRELVLRVKAVMRRGTPSEDAPRVMDREGLRLDMERHRCTVDGEAVELTAKEFGLLAALMNRAGRVLSRERLLDEVWGTDVAVTLRTIDTHLKRLREKLESHGDRIETVRGVGYRFRE